MQTDYIIVFSLLTVGYIFLKQWHYSHYRIIKFNGQELLLACGAAGTFILVLGSAVHTVTQNTFLYYIHFFIVDFLEVDWDRLHDVTIGFMLSMLFAFFYNKFITSRDDTVQNLIKENNDGLELMLLDSLNNTKELAITLSNGKVYVGLVVTEPFSPVENKSFKILPLLSGYRLDNGQIKLNTDYSSIYKNLREKDEEDSANHFSISIAVKDIITCSYFDIKVYEKFNN